MKEVLYQTERLSQPLLGIYTITYHYTDGTTEVKEVPKGEIIIPAVEYWNIKEYLDVFYKKT